LGHGSRNEASVCLYSTNREHMEAIREKGLSIEELDGTVSNFKLDTFFDLERLPRNPDVVLVVVKSYDTEVAVSSILGLRSPSTIFLTLQTASATSKRLPGSSARLPSLPAAPPRERHFSDRAEFATAETAQHTWESPAVRRPSASTA